jgi:hypothetical protein
MKRIAQFLYHHLRLFKERLTQIRDTPHAIAGGVAIGLVLGFTPLLGLKTVLAVLIAWLFRCSKLSAALAVTFHDILLPLMPVILRWQFQIGFYLLYSPHRLPPKLKFTHLHYEDYISWKTLHILWPTFIGSVLMAAPLGVMAYFLTLGIVSRAQARQNRATPGAQPQEAADASGTKREVVEIEPVQRSAEGDRQAPEL